MLRLTVFKAPSKTIRQFSTTSSVLGKKKTKKQRHEKHDRNEVEESEPVEEIDATAVLKDLEKDLKASMDIYNKRSTQIKMGKANPDIFNHLQIPVANKKTVPFVQIAQTTMKGNKYLTITVFDPKDAKHIQSAILDSGMNLNPEADPKNPQLLKVLLPNTSKELKLKQLKELKELTDEFKTGNNKKSLAHLRARYLKDVKNAEGSEDTIRKLETDIEKLAKTYGIKMLAAYKLAEKNL